MNKEELKKYIKVLKSSLKHIEDHFNTWDEKEIELQLTMMSNGIKFTLADMDKIYKRM